MAYQTFAEKYKCLISLMDTESDINFRKGLAISTEDTRAATKVAHSNHQNKAYDQSIFLCNSELWTATKTIEDSFQRKLLRQVMGVR